MIILLLKGTGDIPYPQMLCHKILTRWEQPFLDLSAKLCVYTFFWKEGTRQIIKEISNYYKKVKKKKSAANALNSAKFTG